MDNTSTKKFAFVLGRERELCLAELKAVLRRFCFGFDISSVSDNIAFINIDIEPNDVALLAQSLGGTIKIYEVIGDLADIKTAITSHIENKFQNAGKVTFGISVYLADHLNMTKRALNQLGFQVKKELKNSNISSRYLELKDSTEVPTILSLKEKLIEKGIEFGVFPNALGVLVGLSNPVEWNIRDYEKPAGDKFSGMLPPKLARIMINLALVDEKFNKADTLILDPFCGSGNVLIEGLMLGYNVFGSDISEKAVRDSEANISWLLNKHQFTELNPKVIKADATQDNFAGLISDFSLMNLAIVAEPFLGEPKKFKPSRSAVIGEYKKIASMYIDFFNNMSKLKEFSPVLCVVFPLIETIEGKKFSVYRECVDEIKKIGYTELQSPLIYGRDYQVVKREISLLSLT